MNITKSSKMLNAIIKTIPSNEKRIPFSTDGILNHRAIVKIQDTKSIISSTKPLKPNSRRMSLISRSRFSPLMALLVVAISSMLTTLAPDGQVVDAGLIRIYHKYKAGKVAEQNSVSDASENPPSDVSGAIEQAVLDSGQMVDLIPEASGPLVSRSIEYTSPMKRIMELIGHHSPVIVVSADSQQQLTNPSNSIEQQIAGNGGQQQHQMISNDKGAENPMATLVQAALLPASHMQPQPATTSDHHHWTLTDSNQALVPAAMLAAPQQHHQQFIQSASPLAYEQYYLAPSQQLSADHAAQTHHLAMMPSANLGYSQANSYQQLALGPSFSTANEAHQQAVQQVAASYQAAQQSLQQQQHQSNMEDRAQPVFLSSYVPEITVPAKSVIQSEAPAEKRPDSIQQAVQYSQISQQQAQQPQKQQQQQQVAQPQQPQASPEAAKAKQHIPIAEARSSNQPAEASNDSSSSDNDMADENDPDSGTKAGNSDEPDDGDPSGDMEEPSKTKRSHTAERQAQGSQARQLSMPKKAKMKSSGDNSNSNGNQEESPSGANSSGYMSYEDKFDSDKDEPRKVSTKHSPRTTGNNDNIVDGLIGVGLNEDCLQCICRGSSGCDLHVGCIPRGSEEKYCGPFQLTEEYWNKAGKPRDDSTNFQSFEDCANDFDCAAETVTNYMKRYNTDCDGDYKITCMDYARLHRLKPDECWNNAKVANIMESYWPKFQRCAEGYNRSRNGDDEEI